MFILIKINLSLQLVDCEELKKVVISRSILTKGARADDLELIVKVVIQ